MTFSLRLCQQVSDGWNTDDTLEVSAHWWRRFLLSQEKALAAQNKVLTSPPVLGLTSSPRGTGTNEHLEPREEQRAAASERAG